MQRPHERSEGLAPYPLRGLSPPRLQQMRPRRDDSRKARKKEKPQPVVVFLFFQHFLHFSSCNFSRIKYGHDIGTRNCGVAQLVERRSPKPEDDGSNPSPVANLQESATMTATTPIIAAGTIGDSSFFLDASGHVWSYGKNSDVLFGQALKPMRKFKNQKTLVSSGFICLYCDSLNEGYRCDSCGAPRRI